MNCQHISPIKKKPCVHMSHMNGLCKLHNKSKYKQKIPENNPHVNLLVNKNKKNISVSLDNILHPYEDCNAICNDDDEIIIRTNKTVCCFTNMHYDITHDISKEKSVYENIKTKHYIKIGDCCFKI